MKWPETWIGNLLAVAAIATFGGLGAMMFRDVEGNLVGAVQGLASLMLAVVAVYALFNWRHQEVAKFRALHGAELYSNLMAIKIKASGLESCMSPELIKQAKSEVIRGFEAEDYMLHTLTKIHLDNIDTIENNVTQLISKARILGSDFYDLCENLRSFIDEQGNIFANINYSLIFNLNEQTIPKQHFKRIHEIVEIEVEIDLFTDFWSDALELCELCVSNCEKHIDFK